MGIKMETTIKNDEICIGYNIKRIRKAKGMKQLQLVEKLQLRDVHMSREILGQIERGVHHITATQLRAVKEILDTTYEELLKKANE